MHERLYSGVMQGTATGQQSVSASAQTMHSWCKQQVPHRALSVLSFHRVLTTYVHKLVRGVKLSADSTKNSGIVTIGTGHDCMQASEEPDHVFQHDM